MEAKNEAIPLNTRRQLAIRAADQTLEYPFKVWGFGEEIAIRGLWELGLAIETPRHRDFAYSMLAQWCDSKRAITNEDHIDPGAPLLLAYEVTDETRFLDTARELAVLYETFPIIHGVPVHRPDLKSWQSHIWVDCMYMDAPFLLRLWRITNEEHWLSIGLHHIEPYASVLQDTETGLYWHGYNTATRQHSPCFWGRGNGWAVLAVIDTLELLPVEHDSFLPLQERLQNQLISLCQLQHPSGHWHTVLTDETTPLETSNAAFYTAGLLKAKRLKLISEAFWRQHNCDTVINTALASLFAQIQDDGTLAGVSASTPIGDREHYASRPTGMYPWGQGPLLLAYVESLQYHANGERESVDRTSIKEM